VDERIRRPAEPAARNRTRPLNPLGLQLLHRVLDPPASALNAMRTRPMQRLIPRLLLSLGLEL